MRVGILGINCRSEGHDGIQKEHLLVGDQFGILYGNGGNIHTDPFDSNGVKTKDQYFQFDIAMPENIKLSHVGQRVYVKINHGNESLALQMYRSFEELFLNELGKA